MTKGSTLTDAPSPLFRDIDIEGRVDEKTGTAERGAFADPREKRAVAGRVKGRKQRGGIEQSLKGYCRGRGAAEEKNPLALGVRKETPAGDL